MLETVAIEDGCFPWIKAKFELEYLFVLVYIVFHESNLTPFSVRKRILQSKADKNVILKSVLSI